MWHLKGVTLPPRARLAGQLGIRLEAHFVESARVKAACVWDAQQRG